MKSRSSTGVGQKIDLEYNHNTLLAYGESRLFWEKELIKILNKPFDFDCYDLLNKKYISYEKII